MWFAALLHVLILASRRVNSRAFSRVFYLSMICWMLPSLLSCLNIIQLAAG